MDIEEKMLRYYQNKEIIAERKAENELLLFEIQEQFLQTQEDQLAFQLPNGEYAVLARKAFIRDVLNRDALANEMLVAKDELRTPFDYSLHTKQGRLSPDMISRHTTTETEVKVKLYRRKRKPRSRKKQ